MFELIIFAIFLIIFGHFIFIMKKMDFDVLLSLTWYKNKFISEGKKKMNREGSSKIEDKPNKKSLVKETKKTISNLSLEDRLPFKVTDSADMSVEERKLRERLINKVKKKPAYFYENGEKKIIVPLESLVFLNNDFNPLTSENGDIVIRIDETHVGDKSRYKIYSEDTDEVFLEPDKEQMEAMESLKVIAKEEDISIEEIHELVKKRGIEKAKIEEEKKIKEEKSKKIKNFEPSIELDNDSIKKDADKKVESEVLDFEIEIPADMLEDIEIEEESDNSGNLFSMEDMLDSIEGSDSEGNKKEVIKKDFGDKNIVNFLSTRHWESVEGSRLDFKGLEDSLKNLISENIFKLFSNIVKHKSIVMNDNKTAVFVDNIIMYNSISRLLGNNHKTNMAKFAKIPPRVFNVYKSSMETILEEYLFDIGRDKKFGVAIFSEGDKCFKGFGLWIELDKFKIVFKEDDDFDFFRSYPIASSLKVSEGKNGCMPLIPSPDNIEI